MSGTDEKKTYRVVLKPDELWRVVKASDEREAQVVALLGLLEVRTRLDIQAMTVEEVRS